MKPGSTTLFPSLNAPPATCVTSTTSKASRPVTSALGPSAEGGGVRPAWRILVPREYRILRVTRILPANRRELWRLRLNSLMVHRTAVATLPRFMIMKGS